MPQLSLHCVQPDPVIPLGMKIGFYDAEPLEVFSGNVCAACILPVVFRCPVFHKTDERIRARIFLCMLAYYVKWHMQQWLNPIIDGDGLDSKRRWSFAAITECLRQRCRHTISIHDVKYRQHAKNVTAHAESPLDTNVKHKKSTTSKNIKKMFFLVAIKNGFHYCLRSVNERQAGYQMLT